MREYLTEDFRDKKFRYKMLQNDNTGQIHFRKDTLRVAIVFTNIL